jgi:methionyl-tRNA synthetase
MLGEEGALFPRADVEAFFAEVNVDESKPDGATAPATAEGDLLGIEEFARMKLVVGQVMVAERVPKSKKLVRLEVDLGEGSLRQLVAGIGAQYEPERLIGRRIVVVANLKPAVLMGVESRGMLLAASVEGAPYLLSVDADVPPGTGVK